KILWIREGRRCSINASEIKGFDHKSKTIIKFNLVVHCPFVESVQILYYHSDYQSSHHTITSYRCFICGEVSAKSSLQGLETRKRICDFSKFVFGLSFHCIGTLRDRTGDSICPINAQ